LNSTSAQNILLFVFKTVLPALLVLSCGSGGGGGDGEETPAPPTFPPAVFIADRTTDGVDELYAAFDDGTDIVKLSNTLVADGDVVAFLVSPDGAYAAYVADQDIDEKFELYAVVVDKTAGDTAVKISGVMAGSGLLQLASGDYAFGWAPDSSRIAYIADQTTASVYELFTATPDGADNDRVSGALVADGDVHFFQWKPDKLASNLIAYAADQDTDDLIELYVSPADSSVGNVKVSGAMAGASSGIQALPSGQYDFGWAPDSTRIAYIADQDTAGEFELYTSTPDGAANPKISDLPGSDRDVSAFAWAPDSQKLAYTANQFQINSIDLYTAPPDGVSFLIRQNSTGIDPGMQVGTFKWDSDSNRIAFVADKDVIGRFYLYSVLQNSNTNIFISGSIAGVYDVKAFKWVPDAAYIAFVVEVPGPEYLLYTTFPETAASTQISDDLFDGDEDDFGWAPNSSKLAYIADQDTAGVFELFASVPNGSVIDDVSGTPVVGGDVQEFKWSKDSAALGYLADQDTDTVIELYASLPNGDDNTKLSGTLASGGNVASFDWVP